MEELSKRLLKMIEFSLGCTEPAAIAYNTAHIAKYMKKDAKKISLEIDKMTFKNAFAAGIPNSNGLTGTKNAALLGYFIGDTGKSLEIFTMIDSSVLKRVSENGIDVEISLSEKKELYIHSHAYDDIGNEVEIVTRKTHTGIVEIKENGKYIFKKKAKKAEEEIEFEDNCFEFNALRKTVNELYKIDDLRNKIKKAIEINLEAIEYSKRYLDPKINPAYGAIYARMGGDSVEIASCAGSGNKGIVAIGSLSYIAKMMRFNEEDITKAVILSCLLTSLITSKFGFVSSECGVIHAAGVGVIAALLYLENKLELFYDAFKNYIEATGGVFCDGAKKGCSMKGYVALEMALRAIDLAKNSMTIPNTDGFLGESFKETIFNLMQYDPYFKLFDRETIDILERKS